MARGSSESPTTCCSANARPLTAPRWEGPPATAAKPPTFTRSCWPPSRTPPPTASRELRIEATKQARQSPLFFDLTVSLSKSISIFHASLGENARLARQAGDREGDQYWSALVTEVDDMIWQAVHAGFGYFQREAGYTRTGSHNTRVHGRETGQWHEADLAVAHWLQHTSRDGDMQLHVHSQIAHVARTTTDGKWRAPDSLGYNEHIGAVAAIVSQHLEEALTHRFGLEWTARDDGHGFEIKGISGDMMRVFSSRRESITADLRARAARFEQRYGRKPSQRELAQLAQASNFKTRATKEGALDFAQLHAGWADKLARTLGVSLASVAPSVWHGDGGRADTHARDPDSPAPVPAELEQARAAQKALALAQQEKSTWTRADVIKYLGRVLPRTGLDPAAAAALLEDLADRALRSEFEPVTCLEAPEPAEVPRSLLRADGRSVYQRHGGTRYATRAQLVMEERMLTQARADNAPRLTRAQAAHALGAEPAQLDAALAGRADATQDTRTRTGLRTDQAAAALSVLTDGTRVSVINAPAGSGKTRVLTDTGRAWTAAGLGPVVGITASQSARNTLAAGVPVSYNAAQFLGHLPGRRGARGPVETGPAPLLVIDEASTMPGPDLADLIAYAQARDGKVILAGDTGQLQAVENGGGMSLLAAALGYVRLAEPVRFRNDWEQQASLRLHDGDTTVLAEYDQHGRIVGGEPEQMMDAAAAAYVALAADGTDVLLMAADHALRRELCRRIRDDLIALGAVAAGPAVRIADGAQASAGDLITCTRNDHQVEAGEPGRALANGDLLRIEAVTAGGLVVRRALDADPATGQRRWTDRTFLYSLFGDAELGYAVTDHVAQGRTVHTGLAVITGTEDRQHAYVALTRGTDANLAYVFTTSPKQADPVPGPRPAPELARYDQIHAERADHSRPGHRACPAGHGAGRPGRRAGPRRPAALGHPDPPAGSRRCRPPGRAARDLDRRDRPGPPAALPRPAPGRPAARAPPRDRATRPGGCGAPCAAPNWPAWTPGRSLPTPSPNGTWPEPATCPASSTPGSGTGSAAWSRFRPGPWSAQVPRHRRPRTPRLRHRDRRADGRPQGPPRRARRRARAALGCRRPRPGPRASAGPAGLAEEGRLHRRLAGTIRLRPPRRADRARTRHGRAGRSGRLVRGSGRPRPGRRAGRPRHARRQAAAPARHLPYRNRLGTAVRG